MNDESSPTHLINRRRMLASAVLGVSAAALPAGASASDARSVPTQEPLTAEATEGPYYLALDLVRADITEGKPGIPVDIQIFVMDGAGVPFAGALVDIWHCDAQGRYSGFEQPTGTDLSDLRGKTFLRGVQPVDAKGAVVFHSIYPGWYRGRTTHIHFKVRNGEQTHLTSQFFLPDTLSEFLYDQVPAYQRAELRDTLNSEDGIAIEAGDTVQGCVRETKGRYLVSLAVRVDRSAISPSHRLGRPGEPPPGPPPRGSDARPGRPASGRNSPPPPQTLEGKERIAALLPNAPRHAQRMGPGGPPPGWKKSED